MRRRRRSVPLRGRFTELRHVTSLRGRLDPTGPLRRVRVPRLRSRVPWTMLRFDRVDIDRVRFHTTSAHADDNYCISSLARRWCDEAGWPGPGASRCGPWPESGRAIPAASSVRVIRDADWSCGGPRAPDHCPHFKLLDAAIGEEYERRSLSRRAERSLGSQSRCAISTASLLPLSRPFTPSRGYPGRSCSESCRAPGSRP